MKFVENINKDHVVGAVAGAAITVIVQKAWKKYKEEEEDEDDCSED